MLFQHHLLSISNYSNTQSWGLFCIIITTVKCNLKFSLSLKISPNRKANQRRRFNAPRLHVWNGLRQADGIHGELNFTDTAEEICDEDTSWVPEEKVGPVARSGHTLTLWTNFELWTVNKHKQTAKKHTTCRDLMQKLPKFTNPRVQLMCSGLVQFDMWVNTAHDVIY